MSQPTLQYSTIAGLRCAWIVAGTGPALLLLHGWGASLELMWPLAEQLANAGFRVYAPDLPGFGASEAPPSAWSVRDYANFVLEFLDEHDLQQIDLGGHSFGGRISLMLGADEAQRIRKMLLFNAAGLRRPQPLLARSRLKLYQIARSTLHGLQLKSMSDGLGEWYHRRYASSDYRAAQGVMRPTFVRIVNEDMRPFALRVRPPTLLFWGDQDAETPLWMGKALEAAIPDAGLIVWEGAGHYSYLDRLADTARVVTHFLREEG